jgi:small conductance mechanosensitive channel
MTVKLDRLLGIEIFHPASLSGALFYALVFLTIAALLARALRLAVAEVLRKDERGLIDRTIASFLSQLAQIAIYLIALSLYAHLIPAMRALGTALLAGVSVASVVIGLAAQNTLGNLIAGISLVLYRPFSVGDRVQVTAPSGLETGVVESLTLGYTVLQTFDNRRVVVPNSAMASQVTVNLTSKDARVMSSIPVGIGYGADMDKARAILLDLARNHPAAEAIVGCPVTALGDSSVLLSLRAWVADAAKAKQFEFDILEQAKKRFDREGIEIPFPYRNVVLKGETREDYV